MTLDLDKAEQMLEECYEKIQEQEELIVNLGEELNNEVKARQLR